MLTVCEKNMCAGCMACVDICPKNAIEIADTIGEYNAVIDEKLCIECDACRKVCQQNNPPSFRKPVYWKEGWAKSPEIRAASSSGGFAAALEMAFVRDGGVVCSCEFSGGKFGFSFAGAEADVKKFTGSKYIKSNPEGVYKEIKKLLKSGKKVLFAGLPCQAAAVRNFTGDDEKLCTVDLICHGSPSPKLLDRFLEDYKTTPDKLEGVRFRDNNKFRFTAANQKIEVPTVVDNYTKVFLNGTTYTLNCYSCQYARIERASDITLGDSWGTELSAEEQKKGISLALCQTEKGVELLEKAEVILKDVDLDRSIEHNHQLEHPSRPTPEREKFFSEIKSGASFKKAIGKCYPNQNTKNAVKTVLYKLNIKR